MSETRIYYPGYHKALEAVQSMTERQLYEQIDSLYGRDQLPDTCTLDELRAEALRQTRLDWLNPEHPSYQIFHANLTR